MEVDSHHFVGGVTLISFSILIPLIFLQQKLDLELEQPDLGLL